MSSPLRSQGSLGCTMSKSDWLVCVGLVCLLSIFAIEFHFDVSQRDAFSWMDPQQYYGFAVSLFEGTRPFNDFEVASIFPFFVFPAVAIENSVASALWTNFIFAVILVVGVHLLSMELALKTPSPWIALTVLCSPLLIGLSRSLYVEFSLSALVTLCFVFWLKMLRNERIFPWVIFGGLFYIGILTKMTFPLFFFLPSVLYGIGLLARGEVKVMVRLALVLIIPAVAAVGTVWVFFPRAFLNYYLSFANTTIPISYLFGPHEAFSIESCTYYFIQVGKNLLWLLTPLLLLALFFPKWSYRGFKFGALANPRVLLGAWLIGPLILLIPQVVKEPRHLAPCVVPAVILIFMGIESLPFAWLRRLGVAMTVLLSIGQFSLITSHAITSPYFFDKPLRIADLQRKMFVTDPNEEAYRYTPGQFIRDHWLFNQSIAIAGFEANEGLALSWAFQPAVVIDLDTFDDVSKVSDDPCYREFNDLSILAALNTYNRRCGWFQYHAPFSSAVTVENADLILLKNQAATDWAERYPGYALQFVFDSGSGPVTVLRNLSPNRHSFRELYAIQFLSRHPERLADDENAIAFDLRVTAMLRGDIGTASEVAELFPAVSQAKVPRRKIYFIAGSGNDLHQHVEMRIYRSLLSQPPKTGK